MPLKTFTTQTPFRSRFRFWRAPLRAGLPPARLVLLVSRSGWPTQHVQIEGLAPPRRPLAPHGVFLGRDHRIAKKYEFLRPLHQHPRLPGDILLAAAGQKANPHHQDRLVRTSTSASSPSHACARPRLRLRLASQGFDTSVVEFAQRQQPPGKISSACRSSKRVIVHTPDAPQIENSTHYPRPDVYKRDLDVTRYNVPFLRIPTSRSTALAGARPVHVLPLARKR